MTVSYSETLVSSPIGAQGAYPQTLTKGHEGLIGDLQAYVARSFTNETGAAIPFGHALIRDGAASGDGAKLPAGASATDILGIAVDSNVFEINADAKTADGRVGYPNKEMVNCLSKGWSMCTPRTPSLWVTPSACITPTVPLLHLTVPTRVASARPPLLAKPSL